MTVAFGLRYERMLDAILQYARLTGRLYAGGGAPAIVYSKERTGSVAAFHSLKAAGIPVIATHYLDRAKIVEGKLAGSARWAARHVVSRGRRAKFITLVRNPIDNMLSTFARQEFVENRRAAGRSLADLSIVDHAELAERFLQDYLGRGKYLRELSWFDSELRVALGIDVFDYPFDKTRGIGRIDAGPFELLLLRTEMPDETKAAAIAEFLGVPSFAMCERQNAVEGAPGLAGDKSAYRAHYSEFKRRVTLPPRHWDAIANSKLASHFLTDGELKASRAGWTKSDANAGPHSHQTTAAAASASSTWESSET